MFILLLPPSAHQRECREGDKRALSHLEQSASYQGRAGLSWGWPHLLPSEGLSRLHFSSEAGLIQGP